MKISAIFTLATASAVTAVDIRFANDCYGGWSVACTNMPPSTCCSSNGHWDATILAAVPSNWNLNLDMYLFKDCVEKWATMTERNSWGYCYWKSGRALTVSAGYSFRGKKMARGIDAPEKDASKDCQRVDTLISPDGTSYPISHLTDKEIDILSQEIKNGTAETTFQQFALTAVETKTQA